MPITTYSWTASAGAGTLTSDWTTATDWNPNLPGGTFAGGTGANSAYVINTTAAIDVTGVGATGQTVNELIVDDPNATIEFGTSGLVIDTLQLINGTFNATQDGGQSSIGTAFDVGAGGLVNFGGSTPSSGYTFDGVSSAQLTGSGTIAATGGLASLGPNLTVAAGQTLSFNIADNGGDTAVLFMEGDVNSGTVNFLGGSGLLLLSGAQVGNGTDLSNGTFGATISGLTAGLGFTNGIDIIDGSTIVSANLSGTNNDILTVIDNNGSTVVFNLTGDYTGDVAAVQADSVVGSGFDVFLMVCYAAGTSILTSSGEVTVETIQAGDMVTTIVDGTLVPRTVKWVGRRDLDLVRHPNAEAVAPIRIMQGALGDNLPHRDLVVSPDHCLFIDGALFPAKLLINDMTIVRDTTMETVSYYHVELDQHAIMVAEGVTAESYLDTGNRAFFSNAGLATILHPELNINENLRCWETDACAPLTVQPELVKPVWQRFVDRAIALGFSAPVHTTTKDAGLHLVVDGKTVRPLISKGKTVSFMLPADAKSIRLVSRATRQSALTPWLDDPRTLGVAIRSLRFRDQQGELVMDADHPALRDGWHAAERTDDGAIWRWSAGDAALPVKAFGPCMVEVALSQTATYIEKSARLAA